MAVAALFGLSLAGTAPAQVRAQPYGQSSFSEEMAKLQTHKTIAEQWVRRLKNKMPRQPAAYERGELLYGDARASFDGVITGLQVSLTARTAPKDAQAFHASVDAAVVKSRVFQNFAEAVYLDEAPPVVPMGGAADVIAGVVKGLLEGAGKMFEAYWKEEEARRQQMRKDLDSVRWRQFQDVPQ